MSKKLPQLRRQAIQPPQDEQTPDTGAEGLGSDALAAPLVEPPAFESSVGAPEAAAEDLEPPESAAAPPARAPDHRTRARSIVNDHAALAALGGVVPVPLVDTGVIFGAQMRMLSALSRHYGLALTPYRLKNIALPLLDGIGAHTFGTVVGGWFAKLAPGVGTLVGMSATSGAAAASTVALGELFIDYCEARRPPSE